MQILLFRHGHTDQTAERIICNDNKDVPLSKKGIAEAKLLHKRLEKDLRSFKNFYSAPATRSVQTLQHVAPYSKIITINEFAEIDKGLDIIYDQRNKKQFMTLDDWEKRFNSEEDPVKKINYVYPSGNSVNTYIDSVVDAFKKLLKKGQRDIVICGHNGTVKSILTFVLGGEKDLYYRVETLPGTYSLIEYKRGRFSLKKLNCGL